MKINIQVKVFIRMFNSSFHDLKKQLEGNPNLDEYEVELLINNWLQFNWEIVVEASTCKEGEFLDYYGDGADCFDTSYRVTSPEVEPTHKVQCVLKNGDSIMDDFSKKMVDISKLEFIKFVNFNGDIYQIIPPLTHVLLQDNEENNYLFQINDISFFRVKL